MYKPFKIVADPESAVVLAELTSMDTSLGGKRFTFALKRDYITGNGVKRTNFFLKSHIAAIRRTLDAVELELEQAETEALVEQRKQLEARRNAE